MGTIRLIILIVCGIVTFAASAYGILGYDCASSRLNITTLSLIDVGNCEAPKGKPNATETYIQLLQFTGITKIKVIQCKIEIKRTIFYCGMHSHSSIVEKGVAEYLHEISHDSCRAIHNIRTYKHNEQVKIHGLKMNQTLSSSVTFAGDIDKDGECSGVSYIDPIGSWKNVVVQGMIKITLTEQHAVADLEADRVRLNSGISCPLSDTSCFDNDYGYSFWDPLPSDICQFNRYSLLYEGLTNKIRNKETDETFFSLETKEITFVLSQKGQFSICQYILYRTEHPKLFIFETVKGRPFLEDRKLTVEALDIMLYVNSKFVYVERHIRTQINTLYQNIMYQRCKLEQEVFRNSLILATQGPDEFALHLMKGPGYMSVVAGEVVHIVKCVQVEVVYRKVNQCYQQLPVFKGNESLFLNPRTHILTNQGTIIDCNSFVPTMYQIGDTWYKISPNPVESFPPQILQSMQNHTWKYTNPASLATSGIYSQSDLEKLRKHVMFPAEKPMILNTLARGFSGHDIADQKLSLMGFIDEQTLDRIASSAWGKFWSIFTSFGTASAGLIGIVIIVRCFKLIADTFIHGYTLHAVFGWSFKLLGAFWDSVTNLLLHLGRNEPAPAVAPTHDIELGHITCPPPSPEPRLPEYKNPEPRIQGNWENSQIRHIYPNPNIENNYVVHV